MCNIYIRIQPQGRGTRSGPATAHSHGSLKSYVCTTQAHMSTRAGHPLPCCQRQPRCRPPAHFDGHGAALTCGNLMAACSSTCVFVHRVTPTAYFQTQFFRWWLREVPGQRERCLSLLQFGLSCRMVEIASFLEVGTFAGLSGTHQQTTRWQQEFRKWRIPRKISQALCFHRDLRGWSQLHAG